jgi:glycosyltransferase involved in cell wall biosynthesis
MRLLHVVPTYLPAIRYGGPVVAVHGLCRALASRGHRVEVYTTSIDGRRDSDVPHGEPVLLDGVTVRYFASPILRRLAWAPSLARTLHPQLEGADLVHLHSVFLWPTAMAGRLARQMGTPYVLSPRGMLVKALLRHRHPTLKRAWIELVERRNLEHAAAIHVTSEIEAVAFAEFGFRARQIAVIPNGVDPVENPGTNPPLSADIARLATFSPLILSFGRLSWVKRLDRLIEAFAHIQAANLAPPNLAIVGTDDEGLAPRLRAAAERLGVADRVHIVPRTVAGADKEFLLAAADCVVQASLSESFGNTAVEAMQRGKPVIVSAAVGAAKIVCGSGGGLIVDDSLAQLADAMERLAQQPDLATRMGQKGQDYVNANCGWDQIATQMEELYRSVIDASGPRLRGRHADV